jgi:putative SOS response-associated peptidase YedK
MCGRFTLAAPDPAQLRARFRVDEGLELRRRFNVAPGDDVLATIDRGDGGPAGTLLRWGLVPAWAADPRELGVKTINARAETVA